MDSTVELGKIKFGLKSNFTWGEAISLYSIGEYSIVEYYPHEYVNSCCTSKIDYSKKEYSCYINKEAIGRSASSLDSALVCCIAYKHDGANTRADAYFMTMIGGE
mgnify:FL=1